MIGLTQLGLSEGKERGTESNSMEGPGWKACEVTYLESGLKRKEGHKGERKGGARWGQMIGSFRAWRVVWPG